MKAGGNCIYSTDNCLKLGFTSVAVNGEIRSHCVLFLETLAHGSLKEAELYVGISSKNI